MNELKKLRKEIDALDTEIVELLQRRMEVVKRIGAVKRENHLPVSDPAREREVLARLTDSKVHADLISRVFTTIFSCSRDIQNR